MSTENPIAVTLTGEVFLPVRLFCEIKNMPLFLKKLSKLKCCQFDGRNMRWVWLYEHETKKLVFNKSYTEIPVDKRPIVLGSLYRVNEKLIHMDVGSTARAIHAISFFDKHLGKAAVEFNYCAIYNQLSSYDKPGPNFDPIFSKITIETIKVQQNEKERELMAITSLEELTERTNRSKADDFQLAEGIPTHYYEEGIQNFTTCLQMREIVAQKRHYGEENFTLRDLINEMMLKF